MEQSNGLMIFDDDEQKYAGIAACTSVENAPRVYARVNEELSGKSEKLTHLSQAGNDEITRAERSEIPALTHEVHVLKRLNDQLGGVVLGSEAELFLKDGDTRL